MARKPKYSYGGSTVGEFIRINKTGETIYKDAEPAKFADLYKKWKAAKARRERDEVYRSLGLTKVKGAVSGKTYWE